MSSRYITVTRLLGLLLLVVAMFVNVGGHVLAKPVLSSNFEKEAVIVEDVSFSSGCKYWIDNDVAKSIPCSPGTVIHTREVSVQEAIQSGSPYITLSNNLQDDTTAIEGLKLRFTRQVKPSARPQSNDCTYVAEKNLNWIYGAGPTTTVYVQLKYRVNSNCSVSLIYDETARSGTSTSLCWLRSYVGTPSNISVVRNAWVGTFYTNWLSMNGNNGTVGGGYRHDVANPNGGINDCNNSTRTGYTSSMTFIN